MLTGKLNWVFPGDTIKTLDLDGTVMCANFTSIATPLGAGVIALFISYMKAKGIVIENNSIKTLLDLFIETSTKKQQPIGNTTIDLAYCNPTQALNLFSKFFK